MFDVTSRATYESLPKWHSQITNICEEVPIILLGNKCEKPTHEILSEHIIYDPYIDISVKTTYNIYHPFLCLARHFLNNPDLEFVPMPAIAPPEVQMDPSMIARYEQEIQEAANAELPDDDDEF